MKMILLTLSVFFVLPVYSQKKVLDIPSLHLRINKSYEEGKRQDKIFETQTSNTVLEKSNQEQTSKYKKVVKKVEERITKLSILLDIAIVTQESYKIVSRIKDKQENIIREIRQRPALISLEVEHLLKMAEQMELLGRYLTGVVLTGNDINAMDNADRKVITDFILQELRDIEYTSSLMYSAIVNFKIQESIDYHAFQNWVNRDKQIVEEIIQNAKQL